MKKLLSLVLTIILLSALVVMGASSLTASALNCSVCSATGYVQTTKLEYKTCRTCWGKGEISKKDNTTRRCLDCGSTSFTSHSAANIPGHVTSAYTSCDYCGSRRIGYGYVTTSTCNKCWGRGEISEWVSTKSKCSYCNGKGVIITPHPKAPMPTAKTIGTNFVELVAISGMEYSCDGNNWQTTPKFTNLKKGASYCFYQRYFADYDNSTGEMSNALVVKLHSHTYTNSCDKTCNECNSKRKIKHKYTNNCDAKCNVCKVTRTAPHSYKITTTKATLKKNGSITKKCAVCTKTTKSTIKYVKSFKLTTTNYTYNGKVKTPGVVVKDSAGKTLKKNTDYTVSYASGRRNIGTYKVTVKMIGKYSGTKTLTFKINPIPVSKCKLALSTKTYIYNGKVKTPSVTVKNASGTKLKKGTDYTVTYSKGRKNVGTYKVTVKMKGKYSGTKTLAFKIKLAKIDSCNLSATSYAYDGKVKTPAVTVKNADGTKLTKNTHYNVTYSKGRKNVGTYKVVIKGKGNYTGSKTLTFKIKQDSTKKCKFKLSSTSYTYNGKVKTPTVKVTYGSKTLKKGTDYTVKYASGRKTVGTYKVTVAMKGKYGGTKTLSFKINPPKTTLSKLASDASNIRVYITKKSTQVTGYQIQYSTNKKFTNAKTKTITSNDTTLYKLKNLTAQKTYYVRVRTYKTVGGKRYYSVWSAYKTIKTVKTKSGPIEFGEIYGATYSSYDSDEVYLHYLIFNDDGTVEECGATCLPAKSTAADDETVKIWGQEYYIVEDNVYATHKYKVSGKVITMYGAVGEADENTIINKFKIKSDGSLEIIYSPGTIYGHGFLSGLTLHLFDS